MKITNPKYIKSVVLGLRELANALEREELDLLNAQSYQSAEANTTENGIDEETFKMSMTVVFDVGKSEESYTKAKDIDHKLRYASKNPVR
jgi:hypothetical protein